MRSSTVKATGGDLIWEFVEQARWPRKAGMNTTGPHKSTTPLTQGVDERSDVRKYVSGTSSRAAARPLELPRMFGGASAQQGGPSLCSTLPLPQWLNSRQGSRWGRHGLVARRQRHDAQRRSPVTVRRSAYLARQHVRAVLLRVHLSRTVHSALCPSCESRHADRDQWPVAEYELTLLMAGPNPPVCASYRMRES